MTRRDRFFRAIRREGTGAVPLHLELCPDQPARFKNRYPYLDALTRAVAEHNAHHA